MDENLVQNASEQDTTDTMETQQESMGADVPETAAQGGENVPDDSAQGGGNTADGQTAGSEPFLEIKYNHEKKGLSREEAANWAQKGMHYESAYNALERFATIKGTTVKEFVDGLEAAEDEAHRNSLMERFGGDEETVNQMMELYNIKKEQTLDNASKNRKAAEEAAEQSVNARIAEEFTRMQSDFPELTEFSALPDEVKKAAYEGKTLEHAYLLYKHREAKKIESAKAAEAEAQKKSAGAMGSGASGSSGNVEEAFLSSLWSK